MAAAAAGTFLRQNLSTTATLFWADGVWMGAWSREQQKACRKQIFEVQRSTQSEWTCQEQSRAKLAIWASSGRSGTPLIFDEQVALDMRTVCLQDAKKMRLKQWLDGLLEEMGSNEHECREWKEGVWLEPTQPMQPRKTNEAWTNKHRHVTRKLVVDGGWVQKRPIEDHIARPWHIAALQDSVEFLQHGAFQAVVSKARCRSNPRNGQAF